MHISTARPRPCQHIPPRAHLRISGAAPAQPGGCCRACARKAASVASQVLCSSPLFLLGAIWPQHVRRQDASLTGNGTVIVLATLHRCWELRDIVQKR